MQQIVSVLQGDQACLQGPQQEDAADQGGEPDNDQPEKENHKPRRAIARILGREIEAAARAGRAHGQEAAEQAALAATRAAAAERGPGNRNRRKMARLRLHLCLTRAAGCCKRALRASRRALRALLSMRYPVDGIKERPHPEEAAKRPSRRTRSIDPTQPLLTRRAAGRGPRPTNRCRRTGTARPRRRNASARPPPPPRNDGRA